MPTSLLSTKLYIPQSAGHTISRPHLIARLDEGLRLGRKLTLISAPAGFGKTTLLSAWIASQIEHRGEKQGNVADKPPAPPVPVPPDVCPPEFCWLSLDEGDNDPVRFWTYVAAALQMIPSLKAAGVSTALQTMLQSPTLPQAEKLPIQELLTDLINEIAATGKGRTYVLVLDDYHLIEAQPIHDALTFLIDHLPPQLHITLATRADPPLPIARLRGRGLITELRQTDLRFTTEETIIFLNQVMNLTIPESESRILAQRTEGWAAGLQMACLALQARLGAQAQPPIPQQENIAGFVRAFTGSDRYILDYLVEEVLQRQPKDIQTFLLQTSILDRLSGPLCDAVTQTHPVTREGPAQAILAHLEHANLFITPLDNERRWYRYHHLFADLLRHRLQQTQPGLIPTLYHRAAVWFEQNGLITQAIPHLLRAGDFERAADLIEQSAEATLMRSELATFLGWVDALPEDLICDRPTLCIFQAWALLVSGHPLDAVEARLQDATRSKEVDKTSALRALLALYRGQIAQAGELARQALAQLSEEDHFLHNLATWILSLHQLWDGDLRASTQALDEVARISHRDGNVMVAVMVLGNIAELRMKQGRLIEARDIYQRALKWASDERGHLLPIAGEALMGLGNLLYQWNDLETATRYLSEGIELTRRWGEVGATEGYISLAQIKKAQGDLDSVNEVLEKAKQLALKTDATDFDDIMVAAYQAQLDIAVGNLDAALRWLEERGLTVNVALTELAAQCDAGYQPNRQRRTVEYDTLIRVLLTQNRTEQALALLEPLIKIAQRLTLNERVIRFQILRALALYAQHDIEQSMSALENALSLAASAGYIRIFLDEGEVIVTLLRHAASRGIAPDYVAKLLVAFGETDAANEGPTAARPLVQPPIEALSERELEVLQLLATGMSNPEIADALFIAVSTVRTHCKNIYGKLNVHKRWDAVQRGRELGLL